MSEERKHDQKYEYAVVTITSHKNNHNNTAYATTHTITINTGGANWQLTSEVSNSINAFAMSGYRLKCDLQIGGEVMLIFERIHGDYANYNDEILKYLKENATEV